MNDARQTGSTWQQGGIDPAHVLQVFGMRRSGNHAIIDWLLRNAPEAATGGVFYNNCTPRTDPRKGFATVEVYGEDGAVIAHRHRPTEERLPEAGARPAIVVSYEDRMPPAPRKKAQNISRGFSPGDFDHRVIVYRGFLNWSASLLAKLQRSADWGSVDRFRIITRAFSTYADGLERLLDAGVVGLCYDRWMTSQEYRAERLIALGLPVRDNTRGKVQRFGGGSSFQKKAVSADKLRTTTRGDQMADDPEYLRLLLIAGHDEKFLTKLLPHFEADVERIVGLAEGAKIDVHLPGTAGGS